MTPADYFKLRLEQTLQHLQQETRLLYLVNGAVLTMLYFVVTLQNYPYKRGTLVIILFVLAFVNAAHTAFIMRQSGWFSIFDQQLMSQLKIKKPTPPSFPPIGASWILGGLHFAIALIILSAAVWLWRFSEWP